MDTPNVTYTNEQIAVCNDEWHTHELMSQACATDGHSVHIPITEQVMMNIEFTECTFTGNNASSVY